MNQMTQIPLTEHVPIVRTDFSDARAWESICAIIRQPVDEFYAHVDFVDEAEFANFSPAAVRESIPQGYAHPIIIIADTVSMSRPDNALLILDLIEGAQHEFRATPNQIQAIENNLSIANMEFKDFAGSIDEDGVFRGFAGM